MQKAVLLVFLAVALSAGELEKARDAQDKAALDRLAAQSVAEAQSKPNDAAAQYKAALDGLSGSVERASAGAEAARALREALPKTWKVRR